MKKLLSLAVMLVFGLTTALAQAEIKFDKVTQDLGTFSEESPVKKAVFTFTNVGNQPGAQARSWRAADVPCRATTRSRSLHDRRAPSP